MSVTKGYADALTEALAAELRGLVDQGRFPGIGFNDAMAFLLTDGVVPRPGLPVESFLALDEWARERLTRSQ